MLSILAFHAHEETFRRRVVQRHVQGDDASEADLTVLHAQLATLERLTADEQAFSLTIETDVPQATQRLLDAVRTLGEEQEEKGCYVCLHDAAGELSTDMEA